MIALVEVAALLNKRLSIFVSDRFRAPYIVLRRIAELVIGSGRGRLSSMPEFGVRSANGEIFVRKAYYNVLIHSRDETRRECGEFKSMGCRS